VKIKKQNKSGGTRAFTLIELLVVIAIIGILAGIVLVSLKSVRVRANDNAVFQMMKGLQSAVSLCLYENAFAHMRFYVSGTSRPSMCYRVDDVASPGYYLLNFSKIPYMEDLDEDGIMLLEEKYGWKFGNYCVPGYEGTTVRPSGCAYSNGTCGGDYSSKKFCFLYRTRDDAPRKYIWCTETGCKKQGF